MNDLISLWGTAGFTVMPTRETRYGTATGRYWLTGMKSVQDRESLTSRTRTREPGSAGPRPSGPHSPQHTVTTSPHGQASPSLREMRDLHTLGSYMRLADAGNERAAIELGWRLDTLKRDDTGAQWHAR
jgi:hypothetical protein